MHQRIQVNFITPFRGLFYKFNYNIFFFLVHFSLLLVCWKTAPKFRWERLDTNQELMTTAALTFSRGLNRTDKGVYSCIVENKHGSNVANITMNILCEFFSLFPFFPVARSFTRAVPMIVFKHQSKLSFFLLSIGDIFHRWIQSAARNEENINKPSLNIRDWWIIFSSIFY